MATPGLELLFSSVQNALKDGGDAIICCLHWGMVSNGFKCVGQGEQIVDAAKLKESELLPRGWNADSNVYQLHYVLSGSKDVHLMKVVRSDGTLLVHLLRSSDEKVESTIVNIADYTTSDISTFDSAFVNTEGLIKQFKSEAIDPMKKKTAKAATARPRPADDRRFDPGEHDPLRIGPPRRGGQPQPEWGEPSNPFAIGRGDLDPLAAGRGGGMLFDPMRSGFPGRGILDPNAGLPGPGRLPPGAVPPGARFDPFGPPGVGPGVQRPGPDPDHLPPPGYNDDMFM